MAKQKNKKKQPKEIYDLDILPTFVGTYRLRITKRQSGLFVVENCKEHRRKFSEQSALFMFSVIGSYLTLLGIFFIGLIDLVLLPSKYEEVTKPLLSLPGDFDLFTGDASFRFFLALLGMIAMAIIILLQCKLSERCAENNSFACWEYKVLRGVLIGIPVAFFVGCVSYVMVCFMVYFVSQWLDTWYHLISFIVLFAIPGGIWAMVRLTAKRRDDNLALNSFGICVSVVALYISGLFFLLPD